MSKKGQAAMEFLMTYGWAILVVLAAIGALAYFGVLSPDKFLPERCQFPAGLDCIDKAEMKSFSSAGDGSVVVALRNNIGYKIEITGLKINGMPTGMGCTTPDYLQLDADGPSLRVDGMKDLTSTNDSEITVFNNDAFTVNITCPPGSGFEGPTRFSGDITIEYSNTETGVSHQAVGSIRGKIA